MKEDIGEKVTRVWEDGKWVEYVGEGFGAKRVIATIVEAAAIIGGATLMAFKDYKPNPRTEYQQKTEQPQSAYKQDYRK
jgi:hypothetical protein